jgi:hypothetical protein
MQRFLQSFRGDEMVHVYAAYLSIQPCILGPQGITLLCNMLQLAAQLRIHLFKLGNLCHGSLHTLC